MRAGLLVAGILAMIATSAIAAELSPAAVNDASYQADAKDHSPLLVKAQVLLARAHFSPGEIDGRRGENYQKALKSFADQHGLGSNGDLSEDVWRELTATSNEPIVVEYALTDKDIEGPFLETVPTKLDEMKGLRKMSYGSSRELLAEKFHMSERLLSELNPGQHFDQSGQKVFVVRVADPPTKTKAARLEVDKSEQILRAFDQAGKLIAFFPVTAGSSEKPAPSGELKIRSIARNPTYRYNPEYGFKGVRSKKSFKVAPGPNNPVGLVWIGLPGEGYGIHGTPEPGKVGKTESHGCVRLTNWDALQLADLVSKGVPVSFIGENNANSAVSARRRAHR